MKKLLVLSLMAALAVSLGACGSSGNDCGAGTVELDGACVPLCTDGEYWDGSACQTVPDCATGTTFNAATGECEADIDGCAAGTTLVNGVCVPECSETEHWDGTACVANTECSTGTHLDQATGNCVPDITECAPGTHLDAGTCVPDVICGPDTHAEGDECVPNVLPDPDVTEDDVTFTLPAEGDAVSLGGTIDTPIDEDGDGIADPNFDVFQFTGSAGAYLHIMATSEGAALPTFALMGFDDDENVIYQRIAINPNGLVSEREVYLPYDAIYQLYVTDYNNMVAALFGASGIPVGGPEFTYYIEVETLPAPVPTALDATDLANAALIESGDMNDNALDFYSVSNLPIDSLIDMHTAGTDDPSDLYPTMLVFGPDGTLMTENTSALFVATDGEYLVVQDFELAVGPNRNVDLNIALQPVVDCDVEDCTSGGAEEGGASVYMIDLLANSVFFYSALYGSYDIDVNVYDVSGNLIYFGESYPGWFGDEYAYFSMWIPMDMRLIVRVSGYQGAAATFTQEWLEVPESLLAEGANTGLAGWALPYPWYPAGIDQFTATAGQLVVFPAYTFTEPVRWATPFTLIMDLDENVISATDNTTGDLVEPYMTRLTADGRYLHWIVDNGTDLYPGTYDVTMGLVDVTPSVGMPADDAAIAVTTEGLDANALTSALYFTAEMDAGYKVIATDSAGLIDVHARVMAFANADEMNPTGEFPLQIASDQGITADTGYFVAPYDGDMMVVLTGTENGAVGGETYDLTISKAMCTPGATQCNNDGTDDTVETCDGDAWNLTETCTSGVPCISDDNGGHCYVPGDTCSDAVELDMTSGSASYTGNTSSLTSTVDSSAYGCGYGVGPDMWFTFTLDTDASVTIGTCTGTSFDTVVALVDACGLDNVLGCNDDFCGLQSSVTASLTAGTYFFVVDGYSASASGSFTVNVVATN